MSQIPRRISYRIVLDTNIVMDLLHFADPHALTLAAGLASGRLQCFTDRECLAELARVAKYPGFGLSTAAQNDLLTRYRCLAQPCEADKSGEFSNEATTPLPQCRDPDDQKFLRLAARCHADLLLTRDKALLSLASPYPGHNPERHPTRPSPPFGILTAAAARALFSGLHATPENPAPRV